MEFTQAYVAYRSAAEKEGYDIDNRPTLYRKLMKHIDDKGGWKNNWEIVFVKKNGRPWFKVQKCVDDDVDERVDEEPKKKKRKKKKKASTQKSTHQESTQLATQSADSVKKAVKGGTKKVALNLRINEKCSRILERVANDVDATKTAVIEQLIMGLEK